jgi:hypothetical protein
MQDTVWGISWSTWLEQLNPGLDIWHDGGKKKCIQYQWGDASLVIYYLFQMWFSVECHFQHIPPAILYLAMLNMIYSTICHSVTLLWFQKWWITLVFTTLEIQSEQKLYSWKTVFLSSPGITSCSVPLQSFFTTRHQKMILLIWWTDIHNFFINLWSLPNYKSKHYLQPSYHLPFNLCNNLNTVTNQQRYLQDLRISQHCSWGFRSTRIWCVNMWMVPTVLRGSSGSPFEGQVVPADVLVP